VKSQYVKEILMTTANLPTQASIRRAKKVVRVRKKNDPLDKYKAQARRKRILANKEKTRQVRERQEQALELRMQGITYKDIASALGFANPSSAKSAVDACIWNAEKDAAKEVVALDLARLDEFQMRCMHALRQNGDLHQIDRMMRIMEMRYRLLGITDETVRSLQQDHGIVINQKNMVMNVHAAPETEKDFIAKMMRAVGADPESREAQALLSEHQVPHALPMLEGSANEGIPDRTVDAENDDDIVEAEIVEEM
jgi:hypothetical protein